MPLEYVTGPFGQQIKITDLANADRALRKMLDDAANNPYDVSMLNAAARSNEEWRQQMMLESNAAKAQVSLYLISFSFIFKLIFVCCVKSGELQKLLDGTNPDANLLNACASKVDNQRMLFVFIFIQIECLVLDRWSYRCIVKLRAIGCCWCRW